MVLKESRKIAFGGIVSALSLVFMFLTGIFPFAEYALPALSGLTLVALVIDINKKTAYIAYVAVGLLSLLIAPVKESAVLFLFFLGYYPTLKSSIERIKSRIVEWLVKMALFNVAVVAAYFAATYLLGMGALLDELNKEFQYGLLVFWALSNVAFVLYDFALSRVIDLYCRQIRPKLKFLIK